MVNIYWPDNLLLNCKLLPNARATSPDDAPNVDTQGRQLMTLVYHLQENIKLLLLWSR